MDSKIITKEKLIRKISRITGKDIFTVKKIHSALEDIIFDYASSVDENNTEVTVKLFEGISLNASYIPKQKRHNNLTGKDILVDSKTKTKFNITRHYSEKINGK